MMLQLLDSTTAVPEALIGIHDVVHIRLLVPAVRKNDPRPILHNAIRMLKPGGLHQWKEIIPRCITLGRPGLSALPKLLYPEAWRRWVHPLIVMTIGSSSCLESFSSADWGMWSTSKESSRKRCGGTGGTIVQVNWIPEAYALYLTTFTTRCHRGVGNGLRHGEGSSRGDGQGE
jgi:hypothetical protein